jgi:hypothetical protein
MRPTKRNVSGELAAMRIGGCGVWTGRGATVVFWKRKNFPA